MNIRYIYGLIGFIAGGISGFLLGRYYRKKWFEKELDKIIENEHQWYEKKVKELDEKYEKDLKEAGLHLFEDGPCKPDMPLGGDFDGDNLKKSPDDISEEEFKKEFPPKKAKTRFHDKFRDERIMKEDFNEDEETTKKRIRAGDWKKPYEITEEDFETPYLSFDKVELYYWTEDGIYSDAYSDQPEEDPYAAIGDCLGVVSSLAMDLQFSNNIDPEENTIWVRNEGLGIDYSIEVRLESYQEKVLGIFD